MSLISDNLRIPYIYHQTVLLDITVQGNYYHIRTNMAHGLLRDRHPRLGFSQFVLGVLQRGLNPRARPIQVLHLFNDTE